VNKRSRVSRALSGTALKYGWKQRNAGVTRNTLTNKRRYGSVLASRGRYRVLHSNMVGNKRMLAILHIGHRHRW
jgi:hypothetical protein